MKLILTKQLLIYLFLVVTFSACSSTDSRFDNRDFSNRPVNLDNYQEKREYYALCSKIMENRSLWREKNISNYDFELERFGEGVGGDFIVATEVRNNEPRRAKDIKLPKVRDINDLPHFYKEINSIEKLFDYTQRMLGERYRVTVTFNTQYGFPENLEIKTEGNGWIRIKVTQLQIVE
jgi:hypothetical protein